MAVLVALLIWWGVYPGPFVAVIDAVRVGP
jgi:hypothetical protein